MSNVSLVNSHIDRPKMTDEQIVKALECCTLGAFACGKECPYYKIKSNLKVSSCRFELMCELSDFINRQKAEIERLNKEATEQHLRKEMLRLTVDEVKIEAVKDFWSKLKTKEQGVFPYVGMIHIEDGDNLLKEMTDNRGTPQKEG